MSQGEVCWMLIQIMLHKIKAYSWQSEAEARVKPKARVGAKRGYMTHWAEPLCPGRD
jgi:hypothetical protein